MTHHWMALISQYSSVVGFMIGLPVMLGAYYESLKTRQEARREREGRLHSQDCLEFVAGNGECINLVPLQSLHSLPRAGEVILLPGKGLSVGEGNIPGSYLVESIEHFYSPVDYEGSRPLEARLTKAVAKVTSLNPMMPGF